MSGILLELSYNERWMRGEYLDETGVVRKGYGGYRAVQYRWGYRWNWVWMYVGCGYTLKTEVVKDKRNFRSGWTRVQISRDFRGKDVTRSSGIDR